MSLCNSCTLRQPCSRQNIRSAWPGTRTTLRSGSAFSTASPKCLPTSLAVAREEFASSAVARAAFGDEVVAHYLNAADVEVEAFGRTVTDWERYRGFERL